LTNNFSTTFLFRQVENLLDGDKPELRRMVEMAVTAARSDEIPRSWTAAGQPNAGGLAKGPKIRKTGLDIRRRRAEARE
jgi:hypothetical protein